MLREQKSAQAAEHIRNTNEIFRRSLNAFVGRTKAWPIEDFAGKTGVDANHICRWLRGENCPAWFNIVSILTVLPPAFGNAILRPTGLTGLRRVNGATTDAEALRDIAEAAAVLASALADGRIDHTERPRVARELREALVAIAQWLAKKEGNQ
jgi:hypothetical protein